MNNTEYIIDNVDKAISELVFNKWRLQKAYNYYNGKRDPEQFRYLEENFGIGNPTSMDFTPLLKKHIDYLVGEYLELPLLPKISCKDQATLSSINRDLQLQVSTQIFKYLQSKLNNYFVQGLYKDGVDIQIQQDIDKLVQDTQDNFISQYEIAAQYILQYCIQSRNLDMTSNLRVLLTDLLITGSCFFEVKPTPNGENFRIEILDPLNTFIERNPSSQYVKDSYRAVHRRWMSKQQILNEYGPELSKDSLSELEDMYEHYTDSNYMYIRAMEGTVGSKPYAAEASGLDAGRGIVPGYPADTYESFNHKLLPVYEVQWIDTDKKTFAQTRYRGVRIGQSIYINRGEDKDIIRTIDDPSKCSLSIGGIYLINRDHAPMSLVLQCSFLQDKYDVVQYLRDNVLANSGTVGDWLDISMLPSVLGNDITERLQKWIAYKKSGIGIIDTSQEGRAFNNNTTFAGFDDTIKAQVVQSFDIVLQRIEEQVSSITGVFRERLNGIQQRDAVSNVEAGAKNSWTITKPFYQQMDMVVNDALLDFLNIAKIVWKEGKTGTIVLGNLQKVFTALPQYFTMTDFDVHIVPSTQILKDMQQLQMIVVEMIKGGMLEPDMATEAMTARSMSELKSIVKRSWQAKKKETNNMEQIQQQMQQADQQLKQLTQQNQQLTQKLEQLNEARLQIERDRAKVDADIRWFQARTDRDFKTQQAKNEADKVKIELAQIYDGNPYNDQVRIK